jgi:hypothetical protein
VKQLGFGFYASGENQNQRGICNYFSKKLIAYSVQKLS